MMEEPTGWIKPIDWKARAEAAEKRVTELVWQVNNMRNRAEAAEKERDEFRRTLDKGLPPTIEAQSEINHWRERAKDMEKALQEIVDNTSERSLASNIARAALEATP